jgi:Spy/CpxP family protein refolding chaperone
MDIFTQNKLLIRLIISLALLNVASIGVFVWKDFVKKPRQENPHGNGRSPRPEDFESDRPPRLEEDENGRLPRLEDERKETPQYKMPQDVSTVLETELQLTKPQVAQLQALRADFFQKEQILNKTIRVKKDSINKLMFNATTDETVVLSLARGVAEGEYQMELLRLEQAKTLKTICTPEQLARFNALVIEIRDYFRPIHQAPEKR